jgi:RNA polymerase sigma factor for flagellar operon FliA
VAEAPEVRAVSGRTREQLFVSQLELIEGVIRFISRRHHLRPADAEDFASIVKLCLIENDYEILARFQNRSSLRTYLITVVHRLFLDHVARRWGRWRPSAEAKRLGPVALRLEALLYRDRLSLEEACGVLLAEFGSRVDRDFVHALCERLPRRDPEPVASQAEVSVAPEGLAAVERADRQGAARRMETVLRDALDRLEARDRIILRLHFQDGLSVADVARALGEHQMGLYRRIQKLLKLLQSQLEAEGIGRDVARELLNDLDWDISVGLASTPPQIDPRAAV